ncbi:MAG: aminotransferase class I/II-fold pyridoxal phosphate-dependent enzyme [Phycisphaerales bacterium]
MPDCRSQRLLALPPFLFNEIDNKKRAAIAAGKDVINLGVGDPDRPTPQFVIDEMNRAMRVPVNHQYPDCWGTKRFLEAAAGFMLRRFGVRVDPRKNILATIGGKDGIAHFPLGVLNPGDGAIVFVPAYPVYASGTILAGGRVNRVLTTPERRFRPDFAALSAEVARSSKLMWLNFPGNPTGATATAEVFAEAVRFAERHGLIIASDLAYSEVYFGEPVRSLWQTADIATTRGIEFHSLSKTFNMTGWRVGFAVGHEDAIAALRQAKDNYDSGVFNAIQAAAAVALDRFDDPQIAAMRAEYQSRRDIVVRGLRAVGCEAEPPEAGIFVWARTQKVDGRPMDSWAFSGKLIDEAGVVTVPGAGFDESASGWVRVSLTRETERIAEAMERLGKLQF